MVNGDQNAGLIPAENNERADVFDEASGAHWSFLADAEMLPDFDADWSDCDPRTAPLLAELQRIRREELQAAIEAAGERDAEQPLALADLDAPTLLSARRGDAFGPVAATERLLDSVNRAAMPFHHLISAVLLAPSAGLTETERAVYQSRPADTAARRQLFWQSLIARGASAKEAALFDDAIECRCLEFGGTDRRLIEVDWEVLYRDPLEGCAELYLAEMFLCKRRVYEADDGLRAALEVAADDLARYLPEDVFAPLVAGSIERLFCDGLTASFTLAVSDSKNPNAGTGKQPPDKSGTSGRIVKSPKIVESEKRKIFHDYFDRGATEIAARVETWLSQSGGQPEKTIYRLRLGDYWLDWQRAARRAGFDFDYLETLNDARRVRFYELTKLWRGAAASSLAASDPDGRIAARMEIEYERFVALMPLPPLTSEREVSRQIGALIEPFRKHGYVKSFAVRGDGRDNAMRRARLVFRFND